MRLLAGALIALVLAPTLVAAQVPYTFAGRSGNVPASYLDSDFSYLDTNKVSTAAVSITATGFDNRGILAAARADGARTAPTGVLNGEQVGWLNFSAYGSDGQYHNVGRVYGIAGSNTSGTDNSGWTCLTNIASGVSLPTYNPFCLEPGNVSFGSPQGAVAINYNPNGHASWKNDTYLGINGADGRYTTLDMIAYANGLGTYPGIHLETYGGSKATSATPVTNGSTIGAYSFDAWNGNGDTTVAAMTSVVTQDQAPTANGAGLQFWYTPNGTVTFTKGMVLSPGGLGGLSVGAPTGGTNGDLGPGTINVSSNVYINGVPVSSGGGSTAPGGTNGQIQFNNSGAFGGFTASGDATINSSTGAVAVTKTGGVAFGTAATKNTGTSGATIPLLNAANDFSAATTVDLNSSGAAVLPVIVRNTASGAAGAKAGIELAPVSGGTGQVLLNGYRDGADNTAGVQFYVTNAGTPTDALQISGAGVVSVSSQSAWRSGIGLGTSAVVNTGTSGATIPLLNAPVTFSNNFNFAANFTGDTNQPSNYAVLYHTDAAASGIVGPRSATLLQLVGQSRTDPTKSQEINLIDEFGYGGWPNIHLERYDRGTLVATAPTTTSSPTLTFLHVPTWIIAGAVVSDTTTGLSIGTVDHTTGTTVVLTGNASNPVATSDVINLVGPNNGAVQNGEGLGNYGVAPFDGSSDGDTAGVVFTATETQSNITGHHGTGVTINYTPNGATGTNLRYYGITLSNAGLGGVTIGDLGYQVAPTDEGPGTLNVQNGYYLNGVPLGVGGTHGSWTPTFSFATPGNLSVGYNAGRFGTYTCVNVTGGSLVQVEAHITASAFTFTTASGALLMGPLPFAATNTSFGPGGSVTNTNGNVTWTGQLAVQIADSTHFGINKLVSGSSATAMTTSSFTTGSPPLIDFVATYQSSSTCT